MHLLCVQAFGAGLPADRAQVRPSVVGKRAGRSHGLSAAVPGGAQSAAEPAHHRPFLRVGLPDLLQGAAVSGHPAQLDPTAGLPLSYLGLVGGRHQVDEHDGLSAAVQSGRCHGLLAQPEGRQQKAHRGGMRRMRTGAGAEQCLLRAEFQLLRPLVLYAHPHPCCHDRERAGGPGR